MIDRDREPDRYVVVTTPVSGDGYLLAVVQTGQFFASAPSAEDTAVAASAAAVPEAMMRLMRRCRDKNRLAAARLEAELELERRTTEALAASGDEALALHAGEQLDALTGVLEARIRALQSLRDRCREGL